MPFFVRRVTFARWQGHLPATGEDRAAGRQDFALGEADTDGLSLFEVDKEADRRLVVAAIACGRRNLSTVDLLEITDPESRRTSTSRSLSPLATRRGEARRRSCLEQGAHHRGVKAAFAGLFEQHAPGPIHPRGLAMGAWLAPQVVRDEEIWRRMAAVTIPTMETAASRSGCPLRGA